MKTKSMQIENKPSERFKNDYIKAFKGTIKPAHVSILYKLGISIVAITIILWPLIYIAMIIGVGYGVYYHATENTFILEGRGGGFYNLLVYFAPLVMRSNFGISYD